MKNKDLPDKTGTMRKRDSKAETKTEEKNGKTKEAIDEENAEVVKRDDQGRIIFVP